MSNSPHGNGAYFWIGLQENNLNGFEWTDGGAVKYTNWAPGEPEERADDKQQCTEIGEIGLWSSSMCTRHFPFICQVISFLFKILSLFFQRIRDPWKSVRVRQKLSERHVGKC